MVCTHGEILAASFGGIIFLMCLALTSLSLLNPLDIAYDLIGAELL